MASAQRRPLRCAIYTRKSSEEGLEQDFNSLDAQREACEAYIRSQAGEGWKLVRTGYDDGGYSGGSIERPALERLLADIRDRKLDTVVVYKVDRLTRSLTDFAKIVEVFDAHGISFVSVTQQFNTTTSMGRLTLNMLLSFAQFEREVTGERIRDKIAASKRKGMWMGGFAPLGYEPNGRTLAIHESEAVTVRTIFQLYLEHGNVRLVKEEADRRGFVSKLRPSRGEKMRGGKQLSRGHIYDILSNPLYAGRVAHKGDTFAGQHPPIIDSQTWYAVQAALAANTAARPSRMRLTEPSPLKGKLFDEANALLTPSHAVKGGRRYRYYISRSLTDSVDRSTGMQNRGWRLPAREIERYVRDAVKALLADCEALTHLVRDAEIDAAWIPDLLSAVQRWTGEPLDLVHRAEVRQDEIAIVIDLSHFLGDEGATVRHTVRTRFRRRGVELRLLVKDGRSGFRVKQDLALVKAIIRAHRWFDDLANGRARSLCDIAKEEAVSDRYVSKLLQLAFLAPDIVAAILVGTQPVDLTAETLTKHAALPLDWTEQNALLGFD